MDTDDAYFLRSANRSRPIPSETNPNSRPNSNPHSTCCPVLPFLNSLSPARAHTATATSANSIFSYDPRLLQSVVDMPSLSEAIGRDQYFAENLRKEQKIDELGGCRGRWRFYEKRGFPSFFSLMWSPLLASRLALSVSLFHLSIIK